MPPIYHITHIDNLEGILRSGQLRCKNACANIPIINIAHKSIQDRRALRWVPCGKRGVVHDYVPFYFAPRSPMLFSINRGNVDGYAGDQQSIIHIVSSTEAVINAELDFVFSDGNAGSAISDFFDSVDRFDQIDWELMKARYWSSTQEDPDRSRRRAAEFLVHGALPIALFESLGAVSRSVAERANAILQTYRCEAVCASRSAWYY